MTIATVSIRCCDRCGFEEAGERDSMPHSDGWARISAGVIGGKMRIGDQESGAGDLCPGCAEALFAWWREPAGAVEQPRAPAPPPPVVLTIEDRRAAEAAVVDALRHRTEFVLEAVRNQPTEILSGAMIPGALFGIEDAAAAMVASVLDRFRVPVPGRR